LTVWQTVIDMLAFELPTAVSKFAGVSDRCLEIANCVIDQFIAMCSPRDMLSILCEVCCLDVYNQISRVSLYRFDVRLGMHRYGV
jgi:hypothetical protein